MFPSHDETWHKSRLMRAFKLDWPHAVAFRHEDLLAAGYPDITLTAFGLTTWLEAKVSTPTHPLESQRVQRVTAMRLDRVGSGCRYIVWELTEQYGPRTLIVKPVELWAHLENRSPLKSETILSGHEPSQLVGVLKEFQAGALAKIFAKKLSA